jgi:hypothetical protein
MTDPFETFLSNALAPPARAPDRLFATRVEARIRLDERLRNERYGLLRRLGRELIAIIALAAGLVLLARAPAVTDFAAESPASLLAALISLFALVVVTVGARGNAVRPGGGR